MGYPRGIREPAHCQVASLKALISNTLNLLSHPISSRRTLFCPASFGPGSTIPNWLVRYANTLLRKTRSYSSTTFQGLQPPLNVLSTSSQHPLNTISPTLPSSQHHLNTISTPYQHHTNTIPTPYQAMSAALCSTSY